MKNRNVIVLILDSVLDDYYLLWECYSEYTQIKQNEKDLLTSFSQLLKETFELGYIDFYEGINFNGDEILS